MTARERMRAIDWAKVAVWALHLVIIWPLQYGLVAPAVTLGAAAAGLVRGAFKLGIVGVVLLLLPVIGWILLAAWIVVRAQDRRHREQLHVIAYGELPTPEVPLWRRIWRPWQAAVLW